eukprot:TRINITY_DN2427_c0_g1_i3.p1 TRINITY_DN2427_c0_g1~~TRINITY_DN2427_c0_g1_i3.p1  ORF type:complete len:214 (-),score=15.60 TRINITY_DN2427_c0_g1_i3:112-753(-)
MRDVVTKTMAQQPPASVRQEMLSAFSDFLEVAVNHLLYLRCIYPPEVFRRARFSSVPVYCTRHPELRAYIHDAITDLGPAIDQHPQPSSAGAAHQAQLQARNSPAAQAGGAGNRDEEALEAMEFALRTFLVKASMAECLQQPLPEECAWELVAHSKHLPSSRSPSGQFWVPAECPDRVSASVPSLAAVKSVNTGAMKLQLYVERSNYKAYTIC